MLSIQSQWRLEHRKYLRFSWRGELYQYTCLPNGYFVRCIDDSYLQGSSVTSFQQNILGTKCLFENLGFIVNREISVLHPCQSLIFLNFILDSVLMRVYLLNSREGRQSSFINVKKILAVINATYAVAKRKPEKNQACRDSNPDLCDTGAAL